MKNFKYAIDGMIKRPLMFLIILCQIIVGVSIINTGLDFLFKTYDNVTAIRNTFDMSHVYFLQSVDDNDTLPNNEALPNNAATKNIDNQLLFYNFLVNNTEFKYCVGTNSNLIIKDFTDEDKFYYMTNKKYNTNPYDNIYGDFSDVKAFYVDKNYIDNFKLEIKDGRSFTEEDFEASNNKDYVPIILGSNYSDIYKVNDEFEVFDFLKKELRKVKVVGILKKDTYHLVDISVTSLDNHILYPFERITSTNESNDKYFFALEQQGILISNDINTSFNEILNKAKELNQSNYDVTNAKDIVDLLLDNLKGITKSSLLISGLIIVFTTLGITLIQINNIKDRLKDYGIHLLLGCKKKDIVLRNIYELIIYCVLGTTIGVSFNILSSSNINGTSFDLRILVSIFVIYTLIIFIISLILNKKIRKLEINEIIKGVNVE